MFKFYIHCVQNSFDCRTNVAEAKFFLRPKMGVAPQKHDVISMPTEQYTNTKYISLKRYYLVVSIMLRCMNQIKTFSENLSCREVKIDKILGGDLPCFALICDKFL